jgi:hypothetical protein
VSFRCARCDAKGYAKEGSAASPDRRELEVARIEAERSTATATEDRRAKARFLWDLRQPLAGTPAERYLREDRRYGGPIPSTIGFLPARGDRPPAMISAFAMPGDAPPRTSAVTAVHLTKLALDGRAKAGTEADKIVIGTPKGSPIAVAPINDMLGLAITEGIENALAIHEATQLGAWAAGSAPFLPSLASAVPSWIDCVTVVSDPDPDGRRFAHQLGMRLSGRRIARRVIVWGARRGA